MSNTPPVEAHAPIEMHHFGSGICCQMRCNTGSIFITTRPATIIKSHCRGLKRNTSAPNRAMSCRLAPVAINSIPQQAVANGIGHRLFLRHQLTNSSSLVTATLSGSSTTAIEKLPCASRTRSPASARARKVITPPNTRCRLSTSPAATAASMPGGGIGDWGLDDVEAEGGVADTRHRPLLHCLLTTDH